MGGAALGGRVTQPRRPRGPGAAGGAPSAETLGGRFPSGRARSGSSAERSTRSTSATLPSPGPPVTSSGWSASSSCRPPFRPTSETGRSAPRPIRLRARRGRDRGTSRGSRPAVSSSTAPVRRSRSTQSPTLAAAERAAGREPDLIVILSAESFAGLRDVASSPSVCSTWPGSPSPRGPVIQRRTPLPSRRRFPVEPIALSSSTAPSSTSPRPSSAGASPPASRSPSSCRPASRR